jgi:plasmid maintenance system antidote protein VapI
MEDIHLGSLVKRKMKERGISINEFAEAIHCDRTNVYNIFKRKSMDIHLIVRISNALNYDFLQYYHKRINNKYNTNPRLEIVVQKNDDEWVVEKIKEIYPIVRNRDS